MLSSSFSINISTGGGSLLRGQILMRN